MKIYYIQDGQNNVVNVIIWDGKTLFNPGTGMLLSEAPVDQQAPAKNLITKSQLKQSPR